MRMRTSLILLPGAAVLLGPGCEKNVIGPWGETIGTYRSRTLTSNVLADIHAAYQAAEKARRDLSLTVVQSTSNSAQRDHPHP